ncbi:MAG: cytochrome c [bacterium]
MKRMMLCVVACLGLVACGEGEDDEGWGGDGSGVAGSLPGGGPGQALFASRCATCHGQNGGNLRGRTRIAGIVRRGTDGMPPFPDLSDADIAAIEDYLNGRGGAATGAVAGGAAAGGGVEEVDD